LLGVRICGGEGRHAVILCDECDAAWKTTDTTARATYPEQPQLPCPVCGESLREKPARWATIRDLRRVGWDGKVEGKYRRRAK